MITEMLKEWEDRLHIIRSEEAQCIDQREKKLVKQHADDILWFRLQLMALQREYETN